MHSSLSTIMCHVINDDDDDGGGDNADPGDRIK